jgi:hypothetical protein
MIDPTNSALQKDEDVWRLPRLEAAGAYRPGLRINQKLSLPATSIQDH